MITLKNHETMSLMEAIPFETKMFLLVVTVLAIVVFIVVVFIDNKSSSSCSCSDCTSILPSSLVSYAKLRRKKYRSGQRKEKRGRLAGRLSVITGLGALSRPLGSSLSTPSSSEQDSDDDVIKNYRKSVVLSRQSICQAMMTSGLIGQSESAGKKQDGDSEDRPRDGKKKTVMMTMTMEGGSDERVEKEVDGRTSSDVGGGIFGIFGKKEKKQEKEGFCFKNQVFSPLDEVSPTPISPPKLSTARSFTDLSVTSRADNQSLQAISPFQNLWNKFKSGSTSKLNNDPISLHLTLTYFEAEGQLEVKIIEAKDVPQWAVVTRVKMTLLPMKREKFETKPKPGVCPTYNETTRFRVLPNVDVNTLVLRVRMYGGENRSLLLGWKLINFTRVLRTKSTQFWICLETEQGGEEKMKSSSMQSIVSCSSVQRIAIPSARSEGKVKPELLLGLSYNDLTGFMKVHIVAGTQLVGVESLDKSDTSVYVKLSVMAEKGQEITHNRTSLRACQHDSNVPFQETFAFQIPLCQMESVTLVATAFKVKDKKKEMIGWFALGRSSSGEVETQHWNEMKSCKDEVSYWHVLLE